MLVWILRFLSLSVFCVTSLASAAPRDNDCLNVYSKMGTMSEDWYARALSRPRSKEELLAKAKDDYHELLKAPVTPQNAKAQIEKMVEAYSIVNPSFPKKQFLKWLKDDGPIDAVLSSRANRGAPPTLDTGDLAQALYREYFPFLKKEVQEFNQQVDGLAKQVTDDLRAPLKKAFDQTVQTRKISERDLKSLVDSAVATFKRGAFGSCLTRTDALFKNMVSNSLVGLLMFGLHASQSPPARIEDFPWEFMINGLIWSVVYDRVACPRLVTQDHRFGTPVKEAEKISAGNALKNKITKGVVPMLPYYFAANGSAALGGWYMDRYQRGVSEEKRANEDYLMDWAFFNVFDLAYTLPKRVLLLDTALFTKKFPQLEQAAESMFRSGVAAKMIRYGTEYPLKVAQSEYLQFEVFLKVKKAYEEQLPEIKDTLKDSGRAMILLPKKIFGENAQIEVDPSIQ